MKSSAWIPLLLLVVAAPGCTRLASQDRGTGKELPEPLPGASAPTFERYRSPISASVLDRTFHTRDAMYLANEMNMCGFPFFEEALTMGLGAKDPDFQYMTTVESYWYSRYNMSCLVAESRMGVHAVFGPYVTEWALREGRALDNRDRVEYVRSNKGALLQEIIPMYQARTGFPRRFEDASPLMLHFASGDPHLVRPLDKGTQFESTENLERDRELAGLYGSDLSPRPLGAGVAGNDMWKARVNYRENFLTLRWDHDRMEHVIDLGAEGQTLMKMVLWMEYFFRGSHHGGQFLGNDPEEGFRGCVLNLESVSEMLMLKGAMLYDGQRLTGADPRTARPADVYFPHRIGVRMRLVGDLPPRPEEFTVDDASSQLFDQASLLWGTSEYYHFADPSQPSNWNKVFGKHPPYDGSVMEQKYIVLAEGLSHLIVRNMAAMHSGPGGVLVSEWRPGRGPGSAVTTSDLAMAVIALANYSRHVRTSPEDSRLAGEMLKTQADLLCGALQGPDGSIAEAYDSGSGGACGAARTLLTQGLAVRGLVEAWKLLKEDRYLQGALRVYAYMNGVLWDERTGLYRSEAGSELAVYTPMNVGAAIGAMREVTLATKDPNEIERFKRFWVQGVDSTGLQQSEYEETGERDFSAADADMDGIPRMEFGDGPHGIAPVYAGRVEIRLSPASSTASGR